MCYAQGVIYLGTSGFSYQDWVGHFYPEGMPRGDWLAYYAQEFGACELNSTYYALPRPATMALLAGKTGPGFLFAVKAYQGLTHQREGNAEHFRSFRFLLEPLMAEAKLGCVLAQFPYSFGPDGRNWDYLRSLCERLGGLPLVIEFRNARWLREETFSWLSQNGIGFCCVDEPPLPNLMPPLARATSGIGYVRFHGRNAAKWWRHEHAWERYDYTYSTEELAEWVPKIRHLELGVEKTFVFANNHWRGQAITTIRQLRTMLD